MKFYPNVTQSGALAAWLGKIGILVVCTRSLEIVQNVRTLKGAGVTARAFTHEGEGLLVLSFEQPGQKVVRHAFTGTADEVIAAGIRACRRGADDSEIAAVSA